MVVILFLISIFCFQNLFCVEFKLNSSTHTTEKFLSEEEQTLEELYEEIDKIEEETVSVYFQEEIHLYQEDEGFLESLQQNPLDLNTATYLQLKSLPGITDELARKIVRYRRLNPFKSKSELKKIVDAEVYNKISPFVIVDKVKKAAQLNGQVRIRFYPEEKTEIKTYYQPKEKFEQPYYFYNRTQLSYGDKLSLGYVFLHKPNENVPSLESFSYLLRKWWVRLNSIGLFDKIIFGNYKAGFGYGMVFHENAAVSNLVGSVKPKMRGLREDKSTADNAYLYGLGFESNIGNLEYSIFYSQKDLITKTTVFTEVVQTDEEEQTIVSSYTIDDLIDIRNDYVEYDKYLLDYDVNIETSTINKLPKRKVQEQLVGINFLFPIDVFKIGFCGYYARYDNPFDPDKTKVSGYDLVDKYSERWRYVYRGDNLVVGSLYFEFPLDKLIFFSELAQSKAYFSQQSTSTFSSQLGSGVNLGILLFLSRTKFYLLYTYLEPTFYSPLGIPIKIYDYPNSQRGIKIGNSYKFKNGEINFSYGTAELFKGIWSGHWSSEQPRFPSRYNEIFFETKYKVFKDIELYFRTIDDLRERYIDLKTYGLSLEQQLVQTQQLRIKNRYQVSTSILKDTILKIRYDHQWQKFIDYGKSYYGEQLCAELKYKFWGFTINSRFCIFNSDEQVYLSYLEPKWYNLYMLETEENAGGDKFYFTFSYKISKNKILWLRYRYKFYTTKVVDPTDTEFRIQIDYGF